MTEISPSPAVLAWCRDTLEQLELQPVRYVTLAAEASHRSFWRIETQGVDARPLILMESPPALENNSAFEHFAETFRAHGVPVPKILAKAPELGAYLQTDLGETHLADLYETPKAAEGIRAAIEGLAILQTVDADLERYTRARMEAELEIFTEWFVPWLGTRLDADAFQAACVPLVEAMLAQPFVCIHRDYHSRNLIYQPKAGSSGGRLGLVDFQDALLGPALYDLACLLHDCYYTFPEADIDHWLDVYLEVAAPPGIDGTPAEARRALDFTGLQRQLKALGIFARLKLRDGKTTHLAYIPDNLHRAKKVSVHYQELSALAELLDGMTV